MNKALTLIAYASGMAANNPDCALGPWYLYYHPEIFASLAYETVWLDFIRAASEKRGMDVLEVLIQLNHHLAQDVCNLIRANKPFCVIGGDHSSAMGTWSGVAHAYREKGDIGLIWIDAHMDSHTPDTSESQNIHGMPAAHLLGHGIKALCEILDEQPKLKPENICFVGIRSFEPGEQALLQRLGVKIYYIGEVKSRGIAVVLQEAAAHVSRHTCGYGITIDLDGIDPIDAPGVGYREPNGIAAAGLCDALSKLSHKLLGIEITEYNPIRDEKAKTAKLIPQLIEAAYGADLDKQYPEVA